MSMWLILLLYTFGENLEILAYLFWPALVVLGSALAERQEQAVGDCAPQQQTVG